MLILYKNGLCIKNYGIKFEANGSKLIVLQSIIPHILNRSASCKSIEGSNRLSGIKESELSLCFFKNSTMDGFRIAAESQCSQMVVWERMISNVSSDCKTIEVG